MSLDTDNSYTVNFPDWALSALVNGDYSSFSLEDDDGEESTRLVREFEALNPEFGLPCDCTELTVIPYKKD